MSLADEVLEIHQPKYGHKGDPCVHCGYFVPCPPVRLALSLQAAEQVVEAARQRLQECLCGDSYPEMCPSCQPLASALAEYDKGGQG